MPYVAVLAGLAVLAGPAAALVALCALLAWLLVAAPRVVLWFDLNAVVGPLSEISFVARISTLIVVLTAFFVAWRHARVRSELERVSARVKDLTHQADHAAAQSRALESSIRNLYNRVAAESSSITVLYEQLGSLYSFDQQRVLQATLAAARLMTGATSCAVYQFREHTLRLLRRAVWPPRDEEEYESEVDVATSLMGWVVRTRRLFSLRQLVDNADLRRVDDRHTILCAPIVVRGQLWGVVSIARMPFFRYNEYAEKALQVTAALAAPALEQALPMFAPEEDPNPHPASVTGQTSGILSVERLRSDLELMVRSAANEGLFVALFVVDLQSGLAVDQQAELTNQVAAEILDTIKSGTAVYAQSQANRCALLSAGAGYDASAYLLLRVTELIAGRAWSVYEDTVLPQVTVGFASTSLCGYDAQALIDRAEAVLAMQLPGEFHELA